MAAYLLGRVAVKDWDQYRKYTAATPPIISRFGGRFLVRGGDVETLEGNEEQRRVVLIEFPSVAQARAFFQSDEYAAAKELRAGAAEAEFLILPGWPGSDDWTDAS